MRALPHPAYWLLDLFAGVMIVALFVAVALTSTAWHRSRLPGWRCWR